MEAGGRILSRLYTVKELHDGALNEIPETSGVYFVFMPSNFELVILQKNVGFEFTSKRKSSSYRIEELEAKAEHYGKFGNYTSHLLYVGKAKNLHRRIEQYVGYRYRIQNLFPHDGGRAIWQIENSEKLIVRYMECLEGEDCRKIEQNLLQTYKKQYEAYPFANWKK